MMKVNIIKKLKETDFPVKPTILLTLGIATFISAINLEKQEKDDISYDMPMEIVSEDTNKDYLIPTNEYVVLEDGNRYRISLKNAGLMVYYREDGSAYYYGPSDSDIVIGEGPDMKCYYICYEPVPEEGMKLGLSK